jgi:DNA ligase 1
MQKLAAAGEAIAGTTKKLLKTGIVADYLKSRTTDEAAVSAIFLSGRPFPAWEETTLQVGGRALWRIVAELSGKDDRDLTESYRRHGDLGAVAGEILPQRAGQGLHVLEVESAFRQIAAARGAAAKAPMVRDLISHATPLEAKYIVKIMTGDLRIGLKESLVEDAIARAYGTTLAEVQRANMLLGDIGETVRLASVGRLSDAQMRLFHPIGFMLASPIETPEEGLSYFAEAAIEDKYDGIRAQAHVSDGEVKFFSRTRDEITESFPELPAAIAGLAQDAILDGEIVAWEYPSDLRDTQEVVDEAASEASGDEKASENEKARAEEDKAVNLGRARPFSVLQQRLGRKKVGEKMLREIPVAFLAFDVLYAGGELVMDRPLRERAGILDGLLSERKAIHHRITETQRNTKQTRLVFEDSKPADSEPENSERKDNGEEQKRAARVIRAPMFRVSSAEELEQLFVAAQARGNEGLIIKDLASSYTPGKRGKSWLKMKRELATLDVVVTAVEYGHGRRIGVLSDYTFAVWDTDKDHLVNIGKAYSGLTDVEIAEMTQWFLEHTIPDRDGEAQGFRLLVEPKIVLEVAFNNMMESDRHESGYALRFPRIVRLRPDKSAEEGDTIERAREIFERQNEKKP